MIVANIITRNFIFIVRLLVELASINETLMRPSNGRTCFIGTLVWTKALAHAMFHKTFNGNIRRRMHIYTAYQKCKVTSTCIDFTIIIYTLLYIIVFYIVKIDILISLDIKLFKNKAWHVMSKKSPMTSWSKNTLHFEFIWEDDYIRRLSCFRT